MKKSLISTLFVFVAALIFVACGSAPATETGSAVQNELHNAPKWVLGGASTSDLICGVGSAGGSRNVSVMRTSAMGRGRTEIARMLQLKVQSMLKDYQATTTGGEEFGTAANDEQHIVDAPHDKTGVFAAEVDTKLSRNKKLNDFNDVLGDRREFLYKK